MIIKNTVIGFIYDDDLFLTYLVVMNNTLGEGKEI